jgi:hypothetical protein
VKSKRKNGRTTMAEKVGDGSSQANGNSILSHLSVNGNSFLQLSKGSAVSTPVVRCEDKANKRITLNVLH